MNNSKKIGKCIYAAVLTVLLLFSMTIITSAEDRMEYTNSEISDILSRINDEYGTNIHVLTESELAEYGLPATEQQPLSDAELTELEETLRYIVEVQIPQFECVTQDARTAVDGLYGDMESALSTSTSTVIATKEINYATAGAEAYITTNSAGETIWGSIVKGLCYTDVYQEIWFMASNPTVTHTNSSKTLYWVGEGSYCSYINGTQYYLYSGTQYASMNVGDYD